MISKSTQLISTFSTVNKELQELYILGDLHHLRGTSGLNMYDLFWDNYKETHHYSSYNRQALWQISLAEN